MARNTAFEYYKHLLHVRGRSPESLPGIAPLECPICRSAERSATNITTQCGHSFCALCFETYWLQVESPSRVVVRCPMCRADVAFIATTNGADAPPPQSIGVRLEETFRVYGPTISTILCWGICTAVRWDCCESSSIIRRHMAAFVPLCLLLLSFVAINAPQNRNSAHVCTGIFAIIWLFTASVFFVPHACDDVIDGDFAAWEAVLRELVDSTIAHGGAICTIGIVFVGLTFDAALPLPRRYNAATRKSRLYSRVLMRLMATVLAAVIFRVIIFDIVIPDVHHRMERESSPAASFSTARRDHIAIAMEAAMQPLKLRTANSLTEIKDAMRWRDFVGDRSQHFGATSAPSLITHSPLQKWWADDDDDVADMALKLRLALEEGNSSSTARAPANVHRVAKNHFRGVLSLRKLATRGRTLSNVRKLAVPLHNGETNKRAAQAASVGLEFVYHSAREGVTHPRYDTLSMSLAELLDAFDPFGFTTRLTPEGGVYTVDLEPSEELLARSVLLFDGQLGSLGAAESSTSKQCNAVTCTAAADGTTEDLRFLSEWSPLRSPSVRRSLLQFASREASVGPAVLVDDESAPNLKTALRLIVVGAGCTQRLHYSLSHVLLLQADGEARVTLIPPSEVLRGGTPTHPLWHGSHRQIRIGGDGLRLHLRTLSGSHVLLRPGAMVSIPPLWSYSVQALTPSVQLKVEVVGVHERTAVRVLQTSSLPDAAMLLSRGTALSDRQRFRAVALQIVATVAAVVMQFDTYLGSVSLLRRMLRRRYGGVRGCGSHHRACAFDYDTLNPAHTAAVAAVQHLCASIVTAETEKKYSANDDRGWRMRSVRGGANKMRRSLAAITESSAATLDALAAQEMLLADWIDASSTALLRTTGHGDSTVEVFLQQCVLKMMPA